MESFKKYFIITVDTEGDNLWNYDKSDVTTENVLYIPRFQDLCERYSFKPTYLTNYEIINDDRFVDYIKECISKGTCEVGMHLHAWNSPPHYELEEGNKNDHFFLIQYPKAVMRRKIEVLTSFIKERIGIAPTSHRAGRWIVNDTYLDILSELGYKVDSSVTPHINWKRSIKNVAAVDYTFESERESVRQYSAGNILEVPMTVKKHHALKTNANKSFIKKLAKGLRNYIIGTPIWLRPSKQSLDDMKRIVKDASRKNENYIMFMIHSSELMPGGSPYYKNEEAIEKLYETLHKLFDYIAEHNYQGICLSSYADMFFESKGMPGQT